MATEEILTNNLTVKFIKDVGRPVSSHNVHQNVVKLVGSILPHQSVPEQPSGLVRPDLQQVVAGVLLGSSHEVIAEETQDPARQISGSEQVVTVVIHGES